MNLCTQNSPYYHLIKYLLFLLKHPVYMNLHVIDHLSKICVTYIFKPPLCTTQFTDLQVDSFSFQLSHHLLVA